MAASALLLEKASKLSEHRLLLLMLLLLWWWASTIINVFCRRYPIYLNKVLTSFHLWVHFLFVAFLFCFSLWKKNSFFLILQLSHILNSTSTQSSSFSLLSSSFSKIYNKKHFIIYFIITLFLIGLFYIIILLVYNQEFLKS